MRVLLAVMRPLLTLVRVAGCRLGGERQPAGKAKADISSVVKQTHTSVSHCETTRRIGSTGKPFLELRPG